MEQNFQICLSTLNPRTKHDAAIGGDEGKLISYNFNANEESNTDQQLPVFNVCVNISMALPPVFTQNGISTYQPAANKDSSRVS